MAREILRSWVVLDFIRAEGEATFPKPLPPLEPDPGDTKFFEVSQHLGIPLITGNLKHFPANPAIISPAEILKKL